MAKQKKQQGTGQRPRKTASVLDRLRPEEAQAVLRRLLAAHPELRSDAQQIGKLLLGEVGFEWIADQVEEAVRDLGQDELGSRAGKHGWGYTEPSEAAWELLEERVSPFSEDMKCRFELGIETVRRRFDLWRKMCQARGRIPERLWTSAVKLAGAYCAGRRERSAWTLESPFGNYRFAIRIPRQNAKKRD